MNRTTSLLAALWLIALTVGCGPGLDQLATQHAAQLVVEASADLVVLRVHPLDGSSAQTCPDLAGATATMDGVAMTLSNGQSGWHPSMLPAPTASSACSEYLWTTPFSAAQRTSSQTTFAVHHAGVTWQVVVKNLGAARTLTASASGALHGEQLRFTRAPFNDGAHVVGTTATFSTSEAPSMGYEANGWSSNAPESSEGLLLPIPATASPSTGFLHLFTTVEAEVVSCVGATQCVAVDTTTQVLPFTVW
jgi:hypothetical protein